MVILRFYRKNWLVMTQMISAIQVLNFNRRRARLWVSEAGYWMLEAGYSILSMLDTGCWLIKLIGLRSGEIIKVSGFSKYIGDWKSPRTFLKSVWCTMRSALNFRLPHSNFRIQKSGCAPTFESFLEALAHYADRDRSTTQTASLIAASFRT